MPFSGLVPQLVRSPTSLTDRSSSNNLGNLYKLIKLVNWFQFIKTKIELPSYFQNLSGSWRFELEQLNLEPYTLVLLAFDILIPTLACLQGQFPTCKLDL
ncbi:hypothetical protein ES288_D01G145700v1 [Gossypium darwinii]|uniref:Uncharacterized protein n=1 Tax=Gossypium darwinii TaxID=34276 RepID=A0A5D2DPW3_GOSDA|nr:hypothetical protein ES288_D01G145700v1 [Gossypium darwinii]